MSAPELVAAFETLLDAADEHLVHLRDPLQVELLVSEICAAWSDDTADDHQTDSHGAVGEAFIDYAERCASPGALAVLRGLAALGSEGQRPLAAASADRLADHGVTEPVWSGELGGLRVTGCWTCSDVYGDQTAVLVGFERAGDPHSLVVLVEHNMGEIASDVFVGGDPDQVRESLATEGPLVWYHRISPAEARGVIEPALRGTDKTPNVPLGKTYHATRALARARIRTLPPAPPPAPSPTAVQRARVIADFVISPYGSDLADQDAAIRCAEYLVAHSCAFDAGRMLRVSPMKTQIFLLAWVPLEIMLTERERDALPAVTAAWVRWAGRQRELPEWALRRLDDAVADLGAKFPSVYANPPREPGSAEPGAGDTLPDAEELRSILERRAFALPHAGSRIGDTDYPQLNPTDEHERWLLILGEHPEYHELLAGSEAPTAADSVDELFPQLHLDTHDIVVTQLWNDDPPAAWQAARRLTATGMERHDVLHALCDVVTFHLLAGSTVPDLPGSAAYRHDLDALGRTAQSRSGTDSDP